MGERKVLNKYFPPDFDPKKLPKDAARAYGKVNIRMMLPFSLCCISCGHYMYQGKKFNSRKEVAKGLDYLGIERHRFIIKCEVCMNRISFLTDPKNHDYECESGATRNYSALREQRLAEKDQLREKERMEALGEEDEKKDSMLVLESRTLQSKREIDDIEALHKLQQESRKRARMNADKILKQEEEIQKRMVIKSEEEELLAYRTKRQELRSANASSKQEDTSSPMSKPQDSAPFHNISGIVIRKKSKKLSLLEAYDSSSSEEG